MSISDELYDLLENYLYGKFQRVVLNRKRSPWKPVLFLIPQGSVLGPLLFLIYTNYLPKKLTSNAKLFANYTSLFTTVKNINKTAIALNNDFSLISKWDFNWKMLLNLDPSKPAQET